MSIIVDVVQFMRPNGRQVPHQLDVDDNCEAKYKELTGLGLRLTCEQLMNGTVSQTIECPDFDFDIILTNGADLTENKEALEKLILRFDAVEYHKQDELYNN
jgi:hypothetical protein